MEQENQVYYIPPLKKKKKLTWLWILLPALVLVGLIIILLNLPEADSDRTQSGALPAPIYEPYIGVLYVEDAMTVHDAGSDLFSAASLYNHEFLLNSIDRMIEDEDNAAMMIYIDSPGGEVIAADELASKVLEYKETTGRPVYAYGYSYATSGAYWLAAVADKIVMHKYCLTGSLGVMFNSVVDVSGLLAEYGVMVYEISSGNEKNALTGLTPVEEESLDIYRVIIDEYYQDFVDWISTNRGMAKPRVLELADGRLYTARQAKDNGLIDEVGDFDNALAMLKAECGDLALLDYRIYPVENLPLSSLFFEDQGTLPLMLLQKLLPLSGPLAYYDGSTSVQ